VCGWLGCRFVDEEWVSVQTHEMKRVNAPELRTQVDLLLYQAFPCRLILDFVSNELSAKLPS
jgi:hypothetical protein